MALKWEQRQNEFDKLYDFSQESLRAYESSRRSSRKRNNFTHSQNRKTQQRRKYRACQSVGYFRCNHRDHHCGDYGFDFGTWRILRLQIRHRHSRFVFGHEVDMTAGGLITFVGYFDTLVWPMIALGQVVTMRSRSKASLKRITNFLDQEEEIRNVEMRTCLKTSRAKSGSTTSRLPILQAKRTCSKHHFHRQSR